MDVAELAMMLESMSVEPVSDSEFKAAADSLSNIHGMSDEEKLQFYGLYKQATIGDVNTSRPSFFDFVGQKKWDSWKSYGGFPKESAAMAYVYLVGQYSEDACAADPDRKEDSGFSGTGKVVSTFQDPFGDAESAWDDSEAIFGAVVEGDLDKLQQCLSGGADVNLRSKERMTPLHYAADAGNVEALKLLLAHGADLSAVDEEGQTPLMLAEICDHEEAMAVLSTSGK